MSITVSFYRFFFMSSLRVNRCYLCHISSPPPTKWWSLLVKGLLSKGLPMSSFSSFTTTLLIQGGQGNPEKVILDLVHPRDDTKTDMKSLDKMLFRNNPCKTLAHIQAEQLLPTVGGWAFLAPARDRNFNNSEIETVLQAFLAHLRDRNFNISGEMKTGRGGIMLLGFSREWKCAQQAGREKGR